MRNPLPGWRGGLILSRGMRATGDTIAAIATAPGEAGISIVRVSGSDALVIADTLFRCGGPRPSERAANSFVHGFVNAGSKETDIDEAVLLVYRAPHSYTREDVVELQGHGGYVSARRILRRVLSCGARMAEPGEFTKRAFLNGRLDLLQAEAVADLIRAKSDRAASAALEQLEGSLTNSITSIWDGLISAIADLESSLDFEEGELPPVVLSGIQHSLEDIRRGLADLLESALEGRLIRDGAMAVISGQPNVGKSTLMNRLIGAQRAIVTDRPGTTRDTIEEQILVEGIPLRVVDTAGLRETACDVEREGVRRAEQHMKGADINLHVIDGSRPLDEDERRRLRHLDPVRTVVVINKTDLGCVVRDDDAFERFVVVQAALLHGDALQAIRQRLGQVLSVPGMGRPHAAIGERHRSVLEGARNALDEAIDRIRSLREDQIVLAAAHLRLCLDALGSLTGRTYTEELLDAVFSRFCIGK